MANRILFVVLSLLFSFYTFAQNADPVCIGEKVSIFSKALNENRRIWIYTPNLTSMQVNPARRFPVMYLLDGDAHFFSTVGIVQQLSQANGNGVLPEMIIVAIENTNRLRDLIPYSVRKDSIHKGNPFLQFLSSELIPYIDKHYSTAPYRLLTGHSLGGLTVIDILTNFPRLFNAYIAIDPSMWLYNEKFLNHTIDHLPKQNLTGIRLFVSTANTMYNGMTLSGLKNDKTAETQHIRSIFRLDDFLRNIDNGLVYAQKYYEHERHNTVPLISGYDGLRFIFDYYFFDATEKDFTDTTTLIASKIKRHYLNVSKEMGYQVSAPEEFIKYLAYDALNKKQYRKSDALFKLNIESYPNSIQVYDSYADFFLAQKDTTNAIVNYKKSLQIQKDPAILGKLNVITNKEKFVLSPDVLKKYAGVYILEAYQISVILEIRNSKLWAKVPGESDSELIPLSKDIFTVRGKSGYTITFKMEGDNAVGFTSVQPNGTFKAILSNK